ncbi:decaprenyl-phosphate phosphoribosyltransferase [Micromonospora polyrhachis]
MIPEPTVVDKPEKTFGPIATVEERSVRAIRNVGRGLISLLRPGQWPKNVLAVSLPLLDLEIWSLAALWRVAWAVAAFTVASSIVYVVNDLADRNRDRTHPTKRYRAIASGLVSIPEVLLLLTVQFGLLVGLLSLQPLSSSWPIGAYLVLTTCYSAALKHVPLVDVFVVAFGFGLRMMQGYVAVDTEVSGWLLTSVFLLCLLLILGKRRQELVTTDGAHRPALRGYTIPLTDQLMLLNAVLSVGSYLLYLRTEAPLGNYALATAVLTAPLAMFGMFRYLQMVLVHDGGENPVRMLLRDPALVINALLLVAVSGGFMLAAHLAA